MGLGDKYTLVELKSGKRVIIQNLDMQKAEDYTDIWDEKTGKHIDSIPQSNVTKEVKLLSDYELAQYPWNKNPPRKRTKVPRRRK